MNSYRSLPPQLHSTAESARTYFRDQFGISTMKIETAISASMEFCPTLHAVANDSHIVCVEVNEAPYPTTLDAFLLECRNAGLPVKLFVAAPKGAFSASNLADGLRRAKDNGVGVIEIGTPPHLFTNALSQSLTGLRDLGVRSLPPKYRSPLSLADATFRNGDPAKGCSHVYDELEDLTRRIAKKLYAKGLLTTKLANLDKAPWAAVVQLLAKFDGPSNGYPNLTPALWGTILGITPKRNETGHKPKSLQALILRDRQLRTRFETSVDTLRELIDASRLLRV